MGNWKQLKSPQLYFHITWNSSIFKQWICLSQSQQQLRDERLVVADLYYCFLRGQSSVVRSIAFKLCPITKEKDNYFIFYKVKSVLNIWYSVKKKGFASRRRQNFIFLPLQRRSNHLLIKKKEKKRKNTGRKEGTTGLTLKLGANLKWGKFPWAAGHEASQLVYNWNASYLPFQSSNKIILLSDYIKYI